MSLFLVAQFMFKKICELGIMSLIMVFLIFLMMTYLPGDPLYSFDMAISGTPQNLPDNIFSFKEKIHIFYTWLKGISHGDWGYSVLYHMPIKDFIFPYIKNSLFLIITSTFCAALIALFLVLLSELYYEKWPQKLIQGLSYVSMSTPPFWICILILYLMYIFFPNSQGSFKAQIANDLQTRHILPAILALTFMHIGVYTQHLKAKFDRVLTQKYILTSKAKGVPLIKIFIFHALPNACLPFLGMIAITLGQSLNGQFIIETLFHFPGMGNIVISSLLSNDYALAFTCVSLAMILAVLATYSLQAIHHFLIKDRNPKKS